MALGRRESSHHTQLSDLHAQAAADGEYSPGQRVMTCDGIPGVVSSIEYQPLAGAELYQVTLEGGAGGGLYSGSQLSPLASHVVAGAHLASEDYPELEQVLQERPDIAVNTKMGSLRSFAAGEPEQVHRGLNLGLASDEDVEHLHRDPVGYLQSKGFRAHDTGIHWSTDPYTAHNFALAHDEDEDDETPHTHGVVLHGHVAPEHIVQHGTPEWQNYADENEIFGEGSHEHEKTVRRGAPVHITGVTAVSGPVWGHGGRETEASWGHQVTAGFRTEREQRDMGSIKFGPEVQLRAHDEDTDEHAGTLTYFAPKRKGGPAHVDSLHTSRPGAGSHLLDQMEQAHPGSRTVFLHEEKRGKNTPQYSNGGMHGKPTDWDQHYDNVEGVHRGFSARLPSHDAKTVNSPESEPHEHVQALKRVIDASSAGMHWSANEQSARNFAQKGRMDHRTDIPVVLHGERPERKDIETRPNELFRNGVFPHDYTSEAEVPLRKGRKVKITGMSWKPDTTHPDADENGWMHHTFDEPIHKSAAFDEDDQSFRMQHRAPGPENVPWHEHTGTDPDEMVRIYRGLPHGINRFQKGDWVTTNPDYAHQHSLQYDNSAKWPVITHEVPAHHLWTDENDPEEQGYHGPTIHNPDFHHPDYGVVPHHDAEDYEGGEHYFHAAPPARELHTGAAVHLSPEDHAIVHDKGRSMDERARHLHSVMGTPHLFNDNHEDPEDAAIDSDVDADEHHEAGVHPHPPTHIVLHTREGAGGLHHGISWAQGAHDPDTEYPPTYPDHYTHHTLVDGSHYGSLDSRNSRSNLEGGEEGGSDGQADHLAGRGKPRADGRGAGGAPEEQGAGQPAAPEVGGREEHAGQRVVGAGPVEFHPAALKELKKLDQQSRRQVSSVINDLEQGRPTQTHILGQPLKGWSSTKASRGHRIVHRRTDEGGHYIGHVGLHEYGVAERRLATQMDGGYEDSGDAANEDGIISDGLAPSTASFDPYDLLTTASADPEFGFHFTAAWADVRRKAKRIRAEGGVRITLASEGLVIGEVKGDHHVYETGVQRFPGSRNSIATYSCGCKWGAYHWGASDDFSRFAGRMCSHALALQFEAQSRGMFGRDVVEDSRKPEWVPRKVVVKYDIDDGENQMAKSSSLLEETPLVAFARWAEEQGEHPDEIALAVHAAGFVYSFEVEAAVNSPWGDPQPQPMTYQPGPTKPPNPSDNPGSAGWATMGDPDSWDSITPNELGDRVASIPQEVAQSDNPQGLQGEDAPDGWNQMAMSASVDLSAAAREIFAQAVQQGPPRPSGPKGGTGGDMPPGHAGMPQHRDLAEATLHMEPEGALPFTDGDGPDLTDDESLTPPHTASLGLEKLQAMLGHLNPGSGSAGPYTPTQADLGPVPEGDIAAAARQHLAKQAVKDYSPAEQAAIINEGQHVRAANLDRLDIKDTHYYDPEDPEWLS